ncbi:MAG: hypothetical protein U0L05_06125 [Schaedlerella sp.]|nr:hypothetical protein [Schaedlerella sp.]
MTEKEVQKLKRVELLEMLIEQSEELERCEAMERETAETCKKLLDEAKEGAEKQWAEVSERLENFYDAHQGLRELLALVGGAAK